MTTETLHQLDIQIAKKYVDVIKVDILEVQLRDHDLRHKRDIIKKRKLLLQNGIQGMIIINEVTMDGKTRYQELIDGKSRKESFNDEEWKKEYIAKWGTTMVIAKRYRNLTTREADYIDAYINCGQQTFTPEEKLDYITKYGERHLQNELADLLDIGKQQLKEYWSVVKAEEENKVIRNDRINIRETHLISNANVEDQSLRSIIAKAKFSQSARSEYDVADVVRRINKRIEVKDITNESEETIVRHEVMKQEGGVPNDYQGTVFVPNGSEGKYEAFKRFLEREKPEEIIMLNIVSNDYLVTNNREKQKSQALIAVEYALENDIKIYLADSNEIICRTWKSKHPEVPVIHSRAENYLINRLNFLNKRTILYIHMSGGFESRNILSENTLTDIFLLRPKCVILAIYNTKWYSDITKNFEKLNRFGILYTRKAVIETTSQYLDAIVETNSKQLEWNIEWEKKNCRSVALVSWKQKEVTT